MRLATMIGHQPDGSETAGDVVFEARRAADLGFSTAWMTQDLGWDALTALGLVGLSVPGIRLGTAVVPIAGRHPLVLAGQVRSVQAAIGDRLTLGVGTGHERLVGSAMGLGDGRHARHLREYLDALLPLLRGEAVDVDGDLVRAAGRVTAPGGAAPPVLVAALDRDELRVAGELGDGVIVSWVGPRTIDRHVLPRLAAAGPAGRPRPEVVHITAVSVTDDVDGARGRIADALGAADDLPCHHDALELEGVAHPGALALVGTEREVARRMQQLADAGVSELVVVPSGDRAEVSRTWALLREMCGDEEDGYDEPDLGIWDRSASLAATNHP
ncbi:MAG: TIGR03564 family F420-dependent LLM class oxidoreductase [Actinomycetota bacterium]|nr:TIGR03564 family F420-dependent LLM class oxidoreductase [Actinomycetota bacterium]